MAKIMLVEDDNNLREIYEARLLAEGYEIVSAKDGEEALALAVKERPDLIISDVMMPKISGFDMLDILRSTPETKETKVIMMTALSQAEDKARADKLGADRYLVKSQVTLEDVAKVAREVLQGEESATTVNTAVQTPEEPAAAANPTLETATPISDPVSPTQDGTAPAQDSVVSNASIDPKLAETSAAEEAAVDAQINNFVAQQTPEATASDTGPQPDGVTASAGNASNTQINVESPPDVGDTNKAADNAEKLTEAVNDLLADTDKGGNSSPLKELGDSIEESATSSHQKIITPVDKNASETKPVNSTDETTKEVPKADKADGDKPDSNSPSSIAL